MYNILVVDDERIHREGLIMLLEKICPDDMLWEASNGQEAMEIMKRSKRQENPFLPPYIKILSLSGINHEPQ